MQYHVKIYHVTIEKYRFDSNVCTWTALSDLINFIIILKLTFGCNFLNCPQDGDILVLYHVCVNNKVAHI